jgi:ribosomal-protein-alanine N-acetyltransferase
MELSHKGTTTIETERLILRRFELTDADAMFNSWANDEDVTKYLSWGSHGNIDNSISYFSYIDSDFYCMTYYPPLFLFTQQILSL